MTPTQRHHDGALSYEDALAALAQVRRATCPGLLHYWEAQRALRRLRGSAA